MGLTGTAADPSQRFLPASVRTSPGSILEYPPPRGIGPEALDGARYVAAGSSPTSTTTVLCAITAPMILPRQGLECGADQSGGIIAKVNRDRLATSSASAAADSGAGGSRRIASPLWRTGAIYPYPTHITRASHAKNLGQAKARTKILSRAINIRRAEQLISAEPYQLIIW